jgi:hypothetical protein
MTKEQLDFREFLFQEKIAANKLLGEKAQAFANFLIELKKICDHKYPDEMSALDSDGFCQICYQFTEKIDTPKDLTITPA